MIDDLLGEPKDLNDKALILIEKLLKNDKEVSQDKFEVRFNYFFWDDLKDMFFIDKVKIENVCYKQKYEIEKLFNIFLIKSLSRMNIDLKGLLKLDSEFLFNYRNERDLSELVSSVICLEVLRKTYHCHKVYGGEEYKNEYRNCILLIDQIHPEILQIHQKILGIKND